MNFDVTLFAQRYEVALGVLVNTFDDVVAVRDGLAFDVVHVERHVGESLRRIRADLDI